MRTRTIVTVALLSAAAACGTSGSTRQAPASKPAPAAPTSQAAAPAASPPITVLAVPAPVIAPSTPGTRLGPEQLERLAYELRTTDPTVVAARSDHFRPLCDAEGYPLVGNLMTKSARPAPRPIAELCASVRTERAR